MMAAENARRCILGGVTTVRDCGGVGTITQRLRDMIAADRLVGPRVLSSGMPITTTAGHGHFFGLRADGIDEVRKSVRRLVEDGVDFVKVMATGGRITSGSNMHALQYDQAALDTIASEAHRLFRRVAAHVLGTDGIAACVRAGIDTLEHCRWQDPDGSYRYEEGTLAEMESQGTYVSLTMAGNIRDLLDLKRADPNGFAPGIVEAERFRTESDMVRRGLNTFVTSDAGVTRCRFDEFAQSVACVVEFLGVDPVAAVAHATGRAARALGIDHEVGTLEEGKVADILIVDGDVANDIDALARVRTVVRSGRIVAEGGAVRLAPFGGRER
jgi:imidazolonepropionase-like amidohydrolase